MLERRDTSEPMHVRTRTYNYLQISANSISSRGDYQKKLKKSRAFRACSGAATTIRERGVYSVIYRFYCYVLCGFADHGQLDGDDITSFHWAGDSGNFYLLDSRARLHFFNTSATINL